MPEDPSAAKSLLTNSLYVEKTQDLDRRISVAETKFSYIEETIQENKQKLNCIDDKVDKINEQMVAQSAIFPRVEESIRKILKTQEVNSRKTTASEVRGKIIWGVVAAILTAAIALITKLIVEGGVQ
jgi:chromosome segregation ATPase